MARVNVTIAGVTRKVAFGTCGFPMAGAGAFSFARGVGAGRGCSSCLRRSLAGAAPVLAPVAALALSHRAGRQVGADRAAETAALRRPARVKPRPGRTLDRRWRTEQALRRALIAERSGLKGARDVLAKERPDDSGELR